MLLEGTDIKALLQQVREEHGPDAKIVHAERIRSGGVGGFFAKERYEVSVEVDVDRPPADGIPTMAALLASSRDASTSTVGAASATPAPSTTTASSTTRSDERTGSRWGRRTKPRPEAEPASDDAPTGDVPTEAAAADTSAVDVATDRAVPGTDLVEVGDHRAPTAPSSTDTSALGGAACDLVLGVADSWDGDHGLHRERPVTVERVAAVPARELVPSPEILAHPLIAAAMAASGVTAEDLSAYVAGEPVPDESAPADQARVEREPAEAGPSLTPVGRVGSVPAWTPAPTTDLHPGTGLDPAPSTSPASLELLDDAGPLARSRGRRRGEHELVVAVDQGAQRVRRVPRRPGELLVLLGDPVPAYAAARAIATAGRIPADRIRVVSPEPVIAGLDEGCHIADPVSARFHGAQLAMGSVPAVVVVEAPFSLVRDDDGIAWVEQVVAALGASSVWAVVDATRRIDDLDRWLDCLPEVDALAVHELADTSDPGAVQELGIPVAFVDGHAVATDQPAHLTAAPRRRN